MSLKVIQKSEKVLLKYVTFPFAYLSKAILMHVTCVEQEKAFSSKIKQTKKTHLESSHGDVFLENNCS